MEKGRITAKELYTICKALIDKALQEYAKYVHIVTEMWKECGEKNFCLWINLWISPETVGVPQKRRFIEENGCETYPLFSVDL